MSHHVVVEVGRVGVGVQVDWVEQHAQPVRGQARDRVAEGHAVALTTQKYFGRHRKYLDSSVYLGSRGGEQRTLDECGASARLLVFRQRGGLEEDISSLPRVDMLDVLISTQISMDLWIFTCSVLGSLWSCRGPPIQNASSPLLAVQRRLRGL